MSWIRWGSDLKFFRDKVSQLYVYHSCYGGMEAHVTKPDVGGRRFQEVDNENLINVVGILLLDWLHTEFTGETTDVDGCKVTDAPDYEFVYQLVEELAHRLGVAESLKTFPKAFEWEFATPDERKEMINKWVARMRADSIE